MHLSVLALALVVSVSPFAVQAQSAAAQQATKIGAVLLKGTKTTREML
jgi:hypothetical protein